MHEGHKLIRNEYYDAMYCADCNLWLEEKCDDHRCNFCPQRPKKPSEAIYP